MLKTCTLRSDGGFTLTEILIVTVILALMFSVTFAILSGIFRISDVVESQSAARSLTQTVFHRLGREFSLISSSGRPLLPEQSECGTTQSQASNLHLYSAPAQRSAERVLQQISFVARDAGQHFLEGGGNSGFVQIRYGVSDDSRAQLLREEVPNIRPCERAWERAMVFPLVDGVEVLEFEFFDEDTSQWIGSWTEEQSARLPLMMRYRLVLSVPVPNREPRRIEMSALIPLKAPEN